MSRSSLALSLVFALLGLGAGVALSRSRLTSAAAEHRRVSSSVAATESELDALRDRLRLLERHAENEPAALPDTRAPELEERAAQAAEDPPLAQAEREPAGEAPEEAFRALDRIVQSLGLHAATKREARAVFPPEALAALDAAERSAATWPALAYRAARSMLADPHGPFMSDFLYDCLRCRRVKRSKEDRVAEARLYLKLLARREFAPSWRKQVLRFMSFVEGSPHNAEHFATLKELLATETGAMRVELLEAMAKLPIAEKDAIIEAALLDPNGSSDLKRNIMRSFHKPNPATLARLMNNPDHAMRRMVYARATFGDECPEVLRSALEQRAALEPADGTLDELRESLVLAADDGTLGILEAIAADPSVRLQLRAMASRACREVRERRARSAQR